MLSGHELVRRLQATGLVRPGELRGCSEEDIAGLERHFALRLPAAYKDFLQAIGRNPGPLMNDCQFRCQDLPSMDDFARGMLAACEGGSLWLPSKAFIWLTRPPEQFLYFVADDSSEDPPVFRYVEEQGEFERVADSFWQAIEPEIRFLEGRRSKWSLDDPPEQL
jgi:hypothetical protein